VTSRYWRNVLVFALVAVLWVIFAGLVQAAEHPIELVLNGEAEESGYRGRYVSGRVYGPVQAVFEQLGAEVFWDVGLRMITVAYAQKKVLLELNGSVAIVDGARVELGTSSMVDGNLLLVPLGLVAKGLGMDVHFKDREARLFLTTPEHIATSGVPYGEPVISYTAEELDLFTRVVFAESRDQPYEGYVAAAAVIINRVQSDDFPDTLYDVIMQPGQFAVIANGTYKWEPDDKARRAVQEALMGADPSREALFFFDPSRSTCTSMFSRPVTVEIGTHRFCR